MSFSLLHAEYFRPLLWLRWRPGERERERERKPKDAPKTMGTSKSVGGRRTISKGMAAPSEKVAANVSAACTRRAVVISEIPSSSRECAVKASFPLIPRQPDTQELDRMLDLCGSIDVFVHADTRIGLTGSYHNRCCR